MSKTEPFYRRKLPRKRYLEKGEPKVLTPDNIHLEIREWRPITEEQKEYWQDAKQFVLDRNKKREYLIDFSDTPQLPKGRYRLKIEMLHLDYQGFQYTGEGDDRKELERDFWTVVECLIAHIFAPRLKVPPNPSI